MMTELTLRRFLERSLVKTESPKLDQLLILIIESGFRGSEFTAEIDPSAAAALLNAALYR